MSTFAPAEGFPFISLIEQAIWPRFYSRATGTKDEWTAAMIASCFFLVLLIRVDAIYDLLYIHPVIAPAVSTLASAPSFALMEPFADNVPGAYLIIHFSSEYLSMTWRPIPPAEIKFASHEQFLDLDVNQHQSGGDQFIQFVQCRHD